MIVLLYIPTAVALAVVISSVFHVSLTSILVAISNRSVELNRSSFISFYREVIVQCGVFIMMPLDHIKWVWASNETVDKNKLKVTILPGYTDTDALFTQLHKELRTHDIDFVTIRYKPFFGALEHLANKVANDIKSESCTHHILIAHSMGGLIAERVDDLLLDCPKNVALIHIATPFKGNQMAYLAARPCGTDMLPGSDFIQRLNYTTTTPRLCITSRYDNITVPRQSAVFPEDHAIQVQVDDWRHNGLLQDKKQLSDITQHILQFKQTGRFHKEAR